MTKTKKITSGKVLITGAAGFVGFHLAMHYLGLGREVIGADRCYDSLGDGIAGNIKRVRRNILIKRGVIMEEGDLATPKVAARIFAKHCPSLVFHLAALPGARSSDRQQLGADNVTGFVNVLSAADANPPAHFLFASSSSVYGENSPRPFCEETPLTTPNGHYAASKFAGELAARIWSQNAEFPITIMRFFNIYGPWGRPDMAPFIFADCLTQEREVTIISGDAERSWLYIDDAVSACQQLAEIPPARTRFVNIAGPQLIRTTDVLDTIARLLGKNPRICHQPPDTPEVTSNPASLALLKSLIGNVPQTTFAEGGQKFIDWHVREWVPAQTTRRA